MKTKTIFLQLLLLLVSLPLSAQIKMKDIRVEVSPNQPSWQYKLGEQATFTVRVLRANHPIPNVTIDYELGPEMYPEVKKQNVVLKDGTMTLKGSMKTPGFLRCKVWAKVDGHTYTGLSTVGYAPEALKPISPKPADFEAFWKESLEEVAHVPLNSRSRLLPERGNDEVDVYEISFQNDLYGSRIYGILSLPKKEGRYPALLRVPGAGVRPYTGDTYLASKGCITLEIGIHGIPVTMEQGVYDDLANGALFCYWNSNIQNRYTSYYRRVYRGVVRAIDYLYQLPQFNGKTIGVTGASQGGALSIVAAALDPRVSFYAAIHPALCDLSGTTANRADGWPHYLYYNVQPSEPLMENMLYYDMANFAPLIQAPGWFSFGYNDEVCPPTTIYAVYNSIQAPKEIDLRLETGHFWSQEQYDTWTEWLMSQLNLK